MEAMICKDCGRIRSVSSYPGLVAMRNGWVNEGMGSKIGSGTIGLRYIGDKRVRAIFETYRGRYIYGVETWRKGGIVKTVCVSVSWFWICRFRVTRLRVSAGLTSSRLRHWC